VYVCGLMDSSPEQKLAELRQASLALSERGLHQSARFSAELAAALLTARGFCGLVSSR